MPPARWAKEFDFNLLSGQNDAVHDCVVHIRRAFGMDRGL